MRWTWLILVGMVLAGCGGGEKAGGNEDNGEIDDCFDCDDSELCVVHSADDFDDWEYECADFPDECPGDGSDCEDNSCVSAMYDTCDADYIGNAYSCSGGVVSVTCKPDSAS
ncbi:MAG: hypothetical protein HN348_07275 [Proteobacteria bacterium]|nr:hypothetical protein [Pseudomonadota bacterium]